MNRIAQYFQVSPSAVLGWIRVLESKLCPKPEPEGLVISLELDEMWHYVTSKKNKLWIGKAYDTHGRQLVDGECGGRDQATLERLLGGLEKYHVLFYFTDEYEAYAMNLPKKKTVSIQRKHPWD